MASNSEVCVEEQSRE
uniref:Uncharacterized protein n=1 Tax=Rhizophora mucronata TaxID=61149 RepID=A0A2P2PA64_RHIMU